MSKSTSKGRTPISATDNETFHTLFEEYEGELYRYIRYLCTSSTQAEDIYQETWLRAAQHIAKNREIKNFKNFIFTIATNLFRDDVRKTKFRRLFLGPSMDEESSHQHIDLASTRSAPENIDLRLALKNAMQGLTEKQRIMFTLAHVQGFKIQEISEMMNCASGTVKSTIHRAVQKLRNELLDFRTN
jgi:RNA polymerase sigma-70 factor, ECF subfamily